VTEVGAGGVKITRLQKTKRFEKDYRKLTAELCARADRVIESLTQTPIPSGLRFEKLKGYNKPDVYSVHVTGNYKMSMSIEGSTALLRRVSTHDDIDRQA
jgi:plasmid maintenance system killer protein